MRQGTGGSNLLLPALTLGLGLSGVLSRVVRESVLTVVQSGYYRFALTRGFRRPGFSGATVCATPGSASSPTPACSWCCSSRGSWWSRACLPGPGSAMRWCTPSSGATSPWFRGLCWCWRCSSCCSIPSPICFVLPLTPWSQGVLIMSLSVKTGLGLLLLVVLFALLGPVLWPDPAAQDLAQFLADPSWQEPLGRDQMGQPDGAPRGGDPALPAAGTAVRHHGGAVGVIAGLALGLARRLGRRSAAQPGRRRAGPARPVAGAALLRHGPGWLCHPLSRVGHGPVGGVLPGGACPQPGLLASPQVEASRLLGFGHAHVVRRHLWPELAPSCSP